MFKIRIIRLKDIVKIVMILLLIYVLFIFIKNSISFNFRINQSFKIDTIKYLTLAINTESDVISGTYSKNENQKCIPNKIRFESHCRPFYGGGDAHTWFCFMQL